jgi:DNA-binding NarL/FixJ family response regulator
MTLPSSNTQTSTQKANHLTARQLQILNMLSLGCTRSEIAAAMQISYGTVDRQLDVIFEVLGADNALHAVATALRRGFIK